MEAVWGHLAISPEFVYTRKRSLSRDLLEDAFVILRVAYAGAIDLPDQARMYRRVEQEPTSLQVRCWNFGTASTVHERTNQLGSSRYTNMRY
jgi:hypothetical protein